MVGGLWGVSFHSKKERVMEEQIKLLKAREAQWKALIPPLESKGWNIIPKSNGDHIDVISSIIQAIIDCLNGINEISHPGKTSYMWFFNMYYNPIEGWMNQAQQNQSVIHSIYSHVNHLSFHTKLLFIEFGKAPKNSVLRRYSFIAEKEHEIDTLISKINNSYEALKQLFEQVPEQEERLSQIDNKMTHVEELLSVIDEKHNEAQSVSGAIGEIKKQVGETSDTFKRLTRQSETLVTESREYNENIKQIHKDIENAKNKIIKLLPGATSVGLASSFAKVETKLTWYILAWGVLFFVSIGSLAFVSISDAIIDGLSSLPLLKIYDFIQVKSYKLFLTIPIVWFGWFCARQLGVNVRLQNLYRHKASVSMAFEGYKTQMNEQQTEVASHLSMQTIDTITYNPEQIFHKKNAEDGHPSESFISNLFEKINGLVQNITKKTDA